MSDWKDFIQKKNKFLTIKFVQFQQYKYLIFALSIGIDESRRARSGRELPSGREVSFTTFADSDRPHSAITFLHMTFGQFVDHDLDRTAVTMLAKTKNGKSDTPNLIW